MIYCRLAHFPSHCLGETNADAITPADHSGRPHREREIFFYIHVLQPTPAFLVPATRIARSTTLYISGGYSSLCSAPTIVIVHGPFPAHPTGDKYLTVSYVHPLTALVIPLIDTYGCIPSYSTQMRFWCFLLSFWCCQVVLVTQWATV